MKRRKSDCEEALTKDAKRRFAWYESTGLGMLSRHANDYWQCPMPSCRASRSSFLFWYLHAALIHHEYRVCYVCQKCPARLVNIKSLVAHCYHCHGITFNLRQDTLTVCFVHFQRFCNIFKSDKSDSYYCIASNCHMAFPDPITLIEHVKSHRVCKLCYDIFLTEAEFIEHVKVYHPEKLADEQPKDLSSGQTLVNRHKATCISLSGEELESDSEVVSGLEESHRDRNMNGCESMFPLIATSSIPISTSSIVDVPIMTYSSSDFTPAITISDDVTTVTSSTAVSSIEVDIRSRVTASPRVAQLETVVLTSRHWKSVSNSLRDMYIKALDAHEPGALVRKRSVECRIDSCSLTFVYYGDWANHLKYHHRNFKICFVCSLCADIFPFSEYLVLHSRLCHVLWKVKKQYMNSVSIIPTSLWLKVEILMKKLRYDCALLSCRFMGPLKKVCQHVRKMHFQCKECARIFCCEEDFLLHRRDNHISNATLKVGKTKKKKASKTKASKVFSTKIELNYTSASSSANSLESTGICYSCTEPSDHQVSLSCAPVLPCSEIENTLIPSLQSILAPIHVPRHSQLIAPCSSNCPPEQVTAIAKNPFSTCPVIMSSKSIRMEIGGPILSPPSKSSYLVCTVPSSSTSTTLCAVTDKALDVKHQKLNSCEISPVVSNNPVSLGSEGRGDLLSAPATSTAHPLAGISLAKTSETFLFTNTKSYCLLKSVKSSSSNALTGMSSTTSHIVDSSTQLIFSAMSANLCSPLQSVSTIPIACSCVMSPAVQSVPMLQSTQPSIANISYK